ncbi:MAG: ribonuclease III [Acidimicrobiia bacterium]|nr:ribonuclease III [Acidimicrobiia bacterium]
MSDATDAALERVGSKLGHQFSNPDLLRRALIHRSYAAEEGVDESYERLEFLGDAVLQLAVTHFLFREYPELTEGQMAKVRAAVVNERTLAELARKMDLGPLVLLGRGEERTGGADKDSILSDVIESLIGAVYLEAGFDAARNIVLDLWVPIVRDRATAPGEADYKTRLQEVLARLGQRPRYEVSEEGPEHAKKFSASVFADGRLLGSGEGTSKKRAEQAAAAAAGETLTG